MLDGEEKGSAKKADKPEGLSGLDVLSGAHFLDGVVQRFS